MDGLNALAPLFYDASQDATLQTEVIAGKDLVCNPPFDRVQDFIALVERAYANNAATRCIFIAPD